jgi:hypothetical protein
MPTDYTTLVTSAHNKRSRFMETIALLTGGVASITEAIADVPTAFDVDVAEGAQLDVLGRWVGVSRVQRVPVSTLYFSFDVPGQGWDQAPWKGAYESSSTTTVLDDDTYRVLIKAKIGGNYWRGSREEYDAVASTAFLELGVEVYLVDNLDMTVDLFIDGTPSAELLSMLRGGLTPPKVAGVRIAGYYLNDVYTTIPEAPGPSIGFGS